MMPDQSWFSSEFDYASSKASECKFDRVILTTWLVRWQQ